MVVGVALEPVVILVVVVIVAVVLGGAGSNNILVAAIPRSPGRHSVRESQISCRPRHNKSNHKISSPTQSSSDTVTNL